MAKGVPLDFFQLREGTHWAAFRFEREPLTFPEGALTDLARQGPAFVCDRAHVRASRLSAKLRSALGFAVAD